MGGVLIAAVFSAIAVGDHALADHDVAPAYEVWEQSLH